MTKQSNSSAFGQADPTDGRKPFEWPSKYIDPIAIKKQRSEAIYLGILLFLMPMLMVALWLEFPKYWFHLPDAKYAPLMKYGFAWAAGTLGGVLFISGGLSFFVLALISSGALRIFDSKATNSPALIIGLGFLVGYFSDSAIAKLTEVAETLFGTTRSKEKHKEGENAPPSEGNPTADVGKE